MEKRASRTFASAREVKQKAADAAAQTPQPKRTRTAVLPPLAVMPALVVARMNNEQKPYRLRSAQVDQEHAAEHAKRRQQIEALKTASQELVKQQAAKRSQGGTARTGLIQEKAAPPDTGSICRSTRATTPPPPSRQSTHGRCSPPPSCRRRRAPWRRRSRASSPSCLLRRETWASWTSLGRRGGQQERRRAALLFLAHIGMILLT